ncbi:precursor of CEP14 [Gastrolobium bilobum]|uniref:precursor of CEP14 n=1 Tax=Gastrolobium bilobum TaxID=150636 RepID=UPI002AAF53EC|nr:precursor of CEP14 [Gastrolobium bilobum]
MARFGTFLVLFLVLFASMCSCLEGRKLHLGAGKHSNKVDPSSRDSLFLSSLPKGTVPPSTPSKKGHSIEVDEKLIARHLISTERVLLRSVPSPGAGH